MVEIKGLNELAQIIAYDEIVRAERGGGVVNRTL